MVASSEVKDIYKVGVTFWFSIFSPDTAEVEEGLNGPSTSMNIIYFSVSPVQDNSFFYWCCMNKISKSIYMFRHTADLNTVRYSSILFLQVHYVSPPHPPPIPSPIHPFVTRLLTFDCLMWLPKMSTNYRNTALSPCLLPLSFCPLFSVCGASVIMFFFPLGFRL